MSYRIGIFDPAFRKEGHFVAFDRYVRDLVSEHAEVTFIDQHGAMREAFGDNPGDDAFTYMDLPVMPEPKGWLPGRMARFLARLAYWRKVMRAIERESFDLVIMTADPRDILMCLPRIRFPYAIVIMYPYVFVPKDRMNPVQAMAWFLYRRFVHKAALLITTNEPAIREDISRLIGAHDIHWIPDIPTKPLASDHGTSPSLDFLTIGTISKSKSHILALDAFEQARLPYSYTIAGKALDATGEKVMERTEVLSKDPALAVRGRFGYLDDRDYNALMQSASFLIFPYDFTRGNISSQVLHDAFSTRTPFIAPDIEPFRWYVQQYGIGILYAEGDPKSFAESVRAAMRIGRDAFVDKFATLQEAHSIESIRTRFTPVLVPLLEARHR